MILFEKMIVRVLNLYKNIGIFDKLFLVLRLLILPYTEILRILPDNITNVLDIGCGHGLFSNLLTLAYDGKVKIKGIDYDPKKIKVANISKDNNPFHSRINFQCLNVDEVDTNEKYDCIILTDLLHHISFASQELLLNRIRLALSDVGVLLIKEVDKTPRWKFYWNLCHDKIITKFSLVYYRSHKELIQLLVSLGYRNVKYLQLKKNSWLPYAHFVLLCRTK